MSYVKYRGAKVNVARVGTVKHNGKTMTKVKTTQSLPNRPKGSIDYRSPGKVYAGRAPARKK